MTGKRWNYFKLEEFACPCCGRNEIVPYLIDLLDQAREKAKIPFKITSGYRCPEHNKKVGGSPDSSHMKGLAADIMCNTSQERFRILYALLSVGFLRIGIGQDFIHADIDMEKPWPVVWLY